MTAWPPDDVARFVEGFQARYGVAAYGAPHLNLRAPFRWAGGEAALLERLAAVAGRLRPFAAILDGWQAFPNALYLAVRLTGPLGRAHRAALSVGGHPDGGGFDGEGFVPHLTVALGLLPPAMAELEAVVRREPAPARRWRVSEFAITRDGGGELVEVGRVPLGKG